MVRRVYGHLGSVRHRAQVVEYRVEQHKTKLGDRLEALLAAVSDTTNGTTGLDLWTDAVSYAAPRAPIAQLDRALDYGSRGWGFESSWAHNDLATPVSDSATPVGVKVGVHHDVFPPGTTRMPCCGNSARIFPGDQRDGGLQTGV